MENWLIKPLKQEVIIFEAKRLVDYSKMIISKWPKKILLITKDHMYTMFFYTSIKEFLQAKPQNHRASYNLSLPHSNKNAI